MIDHASSAHHESGPVSDLATQIDRLNAQANSLLQSGQNASQAYQLALQARTLARHTTPAYPRGLADSLTLMARASFNTSQYSQTVQMASEALEIYRELGGDQTPCEAWIALAMAYSQLGDHERALEASFKLLAQCETQADSAGIADALSLAGLVYMLDEQYDEALTYFERALSLYEENNDLLNQAKVHINCRSIFEDQGDLSGALQHGLAALRLYHAAGQPPLAAHLGLGRIYLKQGDSEQALVQGQAALALLDSTSAYVQTRTWLFMGEVHNRMEQPEQALDALTRALALAQQTGVLRDQYQCHEQLAAAYRQQGAFDRALDHYEQFHKLHTRVFTLERAAKLKSMAVLRDTELARQDAARQRELREIDRRHYERLARLKDEYVHTISHDLKSPLAAINLALGLLKKRLAADDTTGHSYLQQIKRITAGMGDLVGQLLDLARFEAVRPICEDVPLAPFLSSVIEDAQIMAQENGLSLHLDPVPRDLVIMCDPGQMRRVLDNLLSNAIKYTPAGGSVRLSASRDGRAVVFAVSDTGIGIPAQALPHLFEPFFRVDDADHLAVQGTGLGLAIVQSIVEGHNGQVEVESTPGHGTTFRITLPDSVV